MKKSDTRKRKISDIVGKLISIDEVAELYYKTVTKRNIYSDNPYKVLADYGISDFVYKETNFEKFIEMFKAVNWRIV